MNGKNRTKAKILDVAEVLFAEYGFNDTSLRTITAKANVNLASVNYHFGDKKNLVRAVLDRYLEVFMPELEKSFIELNLREDYEMIDVFNSLADPLMSLDKIRPNGAIRFMLLLGRGYTDVQGHLRWFISTRYSSVLNLFTESTQKANQDLDPETLFWRLHFTLGTCVFTMSSSQALAEIAYNSFGTKVDSGVVIQQLIPFLAAGVAAKA